MIPKSTLDTGIDFHRHNGNIPFSSRRQHLALELVGIAIGKVEYSHDDVDLIRLEHP